MQLASSLLVGGFVAPPAFGHVVAPCSMPPPRARRTSPPRVAVQAAVMRGG